MFRRMSFSEANPYLVGSNAGLETFQNALKSAFLPQQLQQESEGKRLGNIIKGVEAQYAPQMGPAKLAHLQAQTKREQALADLPFGGHNLPGSAGEVLGLEFLRKIYGEDSPQYERAKSAFDLNQQGDLARINYQVGLTNSLPQRYLTGTGREILEQKQLERGKSPTGQSWEQTLEKETPAQLPLSQEQKEKLGALYKNGQLPPNMVPQAEQAAPPINPKLPEDQKVAAASIPKTIPGTNEYSGVYDLMRQKRSSDTDTRKRVLFAKNIEKTLGQINPKALTQYSSVYGELNKLPEKVKSAFGKASPAYAEYEKSVNATHFLVEQVRQFYGTSIQPEMTKRLDDLVNPSSWTRSPELALQLFNQTKDILGMETGTYQSALKTKDAYEAAKSENKSQTKVTNWHFVNGKLVQQ